MSNSFGAAPQLDPDQDIEMMCAVFGMKPESFLKKINDELRARYQRALTLQVRAAKQQGTRRIIRLASGEAVGEFGGTQLVPELRQALVRRYGAAALKDDGFLKDLAKNHPETRVKTVNDRLTIVRPEFGAKSRRGVHGRRGRWAA